jgi:hypothetical protein
MQLGRLKKFAIGAGGALVLVIAIPPATGWGSATAKRVSKVFVTNGRQHPVRVHEQGTANSKITNTDANGNVKVHEQGTANSNITNTDANGNVKVHEQGTAKVDVTNSSLAVNPPTPVTGGGGVAVCTTDTEFCGLGGPEVFTASALSILMTDGVTDFILINSGGGTVAHFLGPNGSPAGDASTVLALTRPVSVTGLNCRGAVNNTCIVSWIGNSP